MNTRGPEFISSDRENNMNKYNNNNNINMNNHNDNFPTLSKNLKSPISILKKIYYDQSLNDTFANIKLNKTKEDSYEEIMKKIINVNELSQMLETNGRKKFLNKEKEKFTQMQNFNKSHRSSGISSQKPQKGFKLPKIKNNPIAIRFKDISDKKILSNNMSKTNYSRSEKAEISMEKYNPLDMKFHVKKKLRVDYKPILFPNQNRNNILKNLSKSSNSVSSLVNDYKLSTSLNVYKTKSINSKSDKNILCLSQNSFDIKSLSTNLNSLNDKEFGESEISKRRKLISEDIIKKYEINEFAYNLSKSMRNFNLKLKQNKKKISNILNSFKSKEKTHNNVLEIPNRNFVFIYNVSTRINVDLDDITKLNKKNTDYHAMNLNYYNAHRYGNIIKEKYNMMEIPNSDLLNELIRIEKHKMVENLIEKAETKKKILIKRIKIKKALD